MNSPTSAQKPFNSFNFFAPLPALSFFLTLVFAVSIGLIRASPYHHERALHMLPQDCSMPCWAGIHAGVTSTDEALRLLRAHPWVGRIWGVSFMRWTWNGQQPDWIDGDRPGTLSSHYGIVNQIGIPTRLSTGDFWLMFNQLEKGIIFTSGMSGLVYNFVNVNDDLFWIKTDLPCPIQVRAFWSAPALLLLGDMSTFEHLHEDDYDDYTRSGWFRGVSC